jgi:hypothetical protein
MVLVSGRNLFVWVGAVLFALAALLNLAVGAYHTVLFATQGPQSMFSVAYRIPVTAAEMGDPARALGAGAIETYSVLLAGYGLLSLWATGAMLRGRRSGFWLNAAFLGIAQLAVVYGLIVPGHLGGANGYMGPALYALGVAASAVGLALANAAPGTRGANAAAPAEGRPWPSS